MRKTDALVRLLLSDIEGKDILEPACGAAAFSVSAAPFARSVTCVDLEGARLTEEARRGHIRFRIMDASRMDFPDGSFDMAVLYNSFFHIRPVWDAICRECKRVLRENGVIYIVGTWKLDTSLMAEVFGEAAEWKDGFLIVRIAK